MNVFASLGTGYQFGSAWAAKDLRAIYSSPSLLTLSGIGNFADCDLLQHRVT
jgi:hypothetical protein